jgi:hypothetical protein
MAEIRHRSCLARLLNLKGYRRREGGRDQDRIRDMLDYRDFGRTALCAVAALLFTVTTVVAAVGPARAVETAPVAYAQALIVDQVHG